VTPDIYALFRRGKLYYVGLARNLRGRLKQHLRDRHGDSWDRFSVYLTIGDTHMKELESLILRIVQPAGNRQKGKFHRSENLLALLNREMASRDRSRRRRLLNPLAAEPCKVPRCEAGRTPVLAEYVTRPLRLRATHKGKTIMAGVRRDGTVVLRGKRFTSPSLAAACAVRRPTCNGWTFWQYERAPGDWVLLDELRK
jgi:hypothetical protein